MASNISYFYDDLIDNNNNLRIADNNKQCINIINEINDNNPNSAVKIFHTNIRSISRNFEEFIVILNVYPFEFDIIVLSETYTVKNLDLYRISGYHMYYNNSRINRNDGVVL